MNEKTTPEKLYLYAPPTDLLADKVILVTGAGAGIGRGVALAAARCGATCVLLGRQVPVLESLYDEIISNGGPEPAIYPLDLQGASAHDYEELATRVSEALGQIDGVVLNAAQLGTLSPLEHTDVEEFLRVLHVNVTSSFLLLQALLPYLKEQRDASVVFTSSGVGRKARAYWGAYAVSKFGIEGLMQVLADECAETGLRVNSLNPGAVKTRMRATAFPAEDPDKLLTPEAVSAAFVYLLGTDSKHLHGQALNAQ
jgi:NAD(P)-dependent dehydrogenase (short-subunit alcohol dehydrogenase family)